MSVSPAPCAPGRSDAIHAGSAFAGALGISAATLIARRLSIFGPSDRSASTSIATPARPADRFLDSAAQ
jgi:hypothetical protein